jgi:hypothetical protein
MLGLKHRYVLMIFVAAAIFAAVYFLQPELPGAGMVTSIIPTSSAGNPFIGNVTNTIGELFKDKPQAVIEQAGRVGLLLPGGNSVQFTKDAKQTTQDVVIILNAANYQMDNANVYPDFVENEFTFVPPEALENEKPYVRALYPNGFYIMPVNVE